MSRSFHQKHKISRKAKCPWDKLKNYNGDMDSMPEFRQNRKHKPYGLKEGHSGYGGEGYVKKYGFEYCGDLTRTKTGERAKAKNDIKKALNEAYKEEKEWEYNCGRCMHFNTPKCPFLGQVHDMSCGKLEYNCKNYFD